MIKLAFSYSHADEELRDELEKHLSALQRQSLIDSWHDRRISAGSDFENQIDQNFEDASVILLLVSPDFIASDYCYNIEMNRALERHHDHTAVVIPVILRPCHWHQLPFGKLLATPKDGKPVTQFPTLDDGFYQVVESITHALPSRKKGLPKTDARPTGTVSLRNHDASVKNALSPRSSRLRIKKEFSDRDHDKALNTCFDFVARFIENSLSELNRHHQDIETEFRKIDASSFEASIYRNGNRITHCGIWLRREERHGAIYYSGQGVTRNSYNESISVENDEYKIGFRPMGMAFHQTQSDEMLTEHGVGEYLWSMLLERLQ